MLRGGKWCRFWAISILQKPMLVTYLLQGGAYVRSRGVGLFLFVR